MPTPKQTLLRPLLAAAAVCQSASLFAAIPFARGEIALSGTFRVESDSNIFSNNSELSDTVFVAEPGVRYARNAGMANLDFYAGATIYRFADFDSEDSEDPFVRLNFAYAPSQKTTVTANAYYFRNTRADEIVLARVESDDLDLKASLKHQFAQKTGYRIKAAYVERSQLTTGYSDTSEASVSLDGLYEYSPKLFTVAGVTFGTVSTDGTPANRVSPDADDIAATVGLEGDLSPKVKGQIRVGYNWRDFAVSSPGTQDAGYIADTNVTWAAAPDVSFRVFANRSFSVTSSDQSIIRRSFGIALETRFLTKGFFNSTISQEKNEFSSSGPFPSRVDDGLVLTGRLGWEFSERTSVQIGVNIREMDSPLPIADYSRSTWSLGAKFLF